MTYQTQYDTQRALENLTALERQLRQTTAPDMVDVVTRIMELLTGGYRPSDLMLVDLKKQIRIWSSGIPYTPLSSMLFSLHGRDLIQRMEREFIIQRPQLRQVYA